MGLNLRKGGGGFLNGVDGLISGYRWTDEFNGEPFEAGNKPGTKDPKFHSLFLELSVRVDGAEEDATQNLFAGNADDFEFEDGLNLKNAAGEDEECGVGANTPAGKFLQSLVDAKFPESKFGDDLTVVNLEPMVGTRVRFAQLEQKDKNGVVKMRVAKKGKFKGKAFPDTTTIVSQVYELPGRAGKAAPAAKAGKGKPAPVEEADDAETVESLATSFLIKVVTANKGTLAKAKISMALLKPENGLFKHPEREAIRKLLNSDKFLNTEDGWSYNDEKEIVTVED